VVPALRKAREGRGTLSIPDASEIKATRPADFVGLNGTSETRALPKRGSKRSFSAACIWGLPPGPVAWEIPRPPGKGAGLRDDATGKMKFSGRNAPLKPKDGLNGPPGWYF
jgi:hypothetical protein